MPSTINITGTFSGSPVVPSISLASIQGTIVPYEQQIALANGANTITPPTGAIGFLYSPPSGNGVQVTLKGVTGDTGLALNLTNPGVVGIGSGVASFVLTAASAVSFTLVWF